MSTEINITEVIAAADALAAAGEDARAEETLRDAIARYAAARPDDAVGQSVLLNELGGFYRGRGIYDKGEAAYLKAKELLEQVRTCLRTADGPAVPAGCSACPAGDDPFRRAGSSHVEIVLGSGSLTVNYATTLNNLAGLYRMAGQLDRAADTFDAAIEAYENCEETVPPDSLASVYNNRGLLCLDRRETAEAGAMFRKALEILRRSGDRGFALGTTVSNLGFAALLEGRTPDAAARFREAKALFEVAGSEEMAQNCADLLARLETEQ